jgi:hypothetical protein
MSTKRTKNSGLGRALTKGQHARGRKNASGEIIQVCSFLLPSLQIHSKEAVNQDSILDQSDFDTLMSYVELTGKSFEVEHERAVIISNESWIVEQMDPEMIEQMEKHWNDLTIPKRFYFTLFALTT